MRLLLSCLLFFCLLLCSTACVPAQGDPFAYAAAPFSVTVEGMDRSESLVQLQNACAPITVTPSGMVTLVRWWHSINARSPITVTPSGMTTAVSFVSKKSGKPFDAALRLQDGKAVFDFS